jgi:2-amino-4-hydroxy-6-hydroxymethyldihydropteridine diphosphokinase
MLARYRYFASIGSNIDPRTNIPLILEELLCGVPQLHISRIIETEAVGMLDNSQPFFNLTAAFDSDLDYAELKAWFVTIETRLGRDRNHPLRKTRGRPADIDMEFRLTRDNQQVLLASLSPEPHIRPMLIELLAFLNIAHFDNRLLPMGDLINLHDLPIGLDAMTLITTP